MVKADQVKNTQKPTISLAARAGVAHLVLMMDAADPTQAIEDVSRLPPRSVVVFRAYSDPDREIKARLLLSYAHAQSHLFLVAGDIALARKLGADGVHLPEYMLSHTRPNLFGFSFVSAACHNAIALRRAASLGVDLAIVSPVFATNSHPTQRPLGVHRFARMVHGARLPVAALGGINVRTVGQLSGLGIEAVAGMSGIV